MLNKRCYLLPLLPRLMLPLPRLPPLLPRLLVLLLLNCRYLLVLQPVVASPPAATAAIVAAIATTAVGSNLRGAPAGGRGCPARVDCRTRGNPKRQGRRSRSTHPPGAFVCVFVCERDGHLACAAKGTTANVTTSPKSSLTADHGKIAHPLLSFC